MTGRASYASAEPAYSLPVFDRLAPAPSSALVAARIELQTGPGDVVADLFGRGGWVARLEPAHADARRGRAATAGRPPPRRRLPGHGCLTAWRYQPQGVDWRPVRDALRDLRTDARCRRHRLVARGRRWQSDRTAAAGDPALPLHGLPGPARRLGAAAGSAGRRRPGAGLERRRGRCHARHAARSIPRHCRCAHPAR